MDGLAFRQALLFASLGGIPTGSSPSGRGATPGLTAEAAGAEQTPTGLLKDPLSRAVYFAELTGVHPGPDGRRRHTRFKHPDRDPQERADGSQKPQRGSCTTREAPLSAQRPTGTPRGATEEAMALRERMGARRTLLSGSAVVLGRRRARTSEIGAPSPALPRQVRRGSARGSPGGHEPLERSGDDRCCWRSTSRARRPAACRPRARWRSASISARPTRWWRSPARASPPRCTTRPARRDGASVVALSSGGVLVGGEPPVFGCPSSRNRGIVSVKRLMGRRCRSHRDAACCPTRSSRATAPTR